VSRRSSVGGLSTKIHLAADRRCRPVTRILTPGQHGDCPQFIPLLNQVRIARRGKGRPRTRPGTAMADKAYSSAPGGHDTRFPPYWGGG
jgi:hypothetical protein